MTQETFLSGFCRQEDNTRMVAVEYEENPRTLLEIDCCYENCVHRGSCEIGKAVTRLLEE